MTKEQAMAKWGLVPKPIVEVVEFYDSCLAVFVNGRYIVHDPTRSLAHTYKERLDESITKVMP